MKWLVWNEWDKREDATVVDAGYPEVAAKDFAADYDRRHADYAEVREVFVAEARNGAKAVKYNVTIEQVPRYHAVEVK
jgi:hypothetical protein